MKSRFAVRTAVRCKRMATRTPRMRADIPRTKGKTWTGFANSEEQFADNFVGQRIQPFWIEDEARRIQGTHFEVAPMFARFAVRDSRFATGIW